MNKSTGTSVPNRLKNKWCPCGQQSIGIFRGEHVCKNCKRIEQRLDEHFPASTLFKFRKMEAQRAEQYAEDRWAAYVKSLETPAPVVPEGKILISGYAHYIL